MANGTGETLIHLDGVTKVFVTDEVETHALSGIHMEIKRGEYISIAGPSGCGKSTLLAILGLLDSPSDGTYVLKTGEAAGASPGWYRVTVASVSIFPAVPGQPYRIPQSLLPEK